MLVVDASAGPSSIHGMGLILREAVPAGAVIWRFQPGFDLAYSEAEYQALPASARRTVDHYAYHCAAAGIYVLSSDDDRFTNHSPEPSSRFVDGVTLALSDLAPGDEITMNYDEFSMLDALPGMLAEAVLAGRNPQD